MISINLVYEDELQKAVMLRIMGIFGDKYYPGTFFPGSGFGYIKKRIHNFNKASQMMPYFVLTDLDTTPCAPVKIAEWLPEEKNPNLIFRIAVPEVESWLYADIVNFPKQLRCQYNIPNGADATEDGKKFLFSIIKRTAPKKIQEDILPEKGTSAKIGRGYNPLLCDFVARHWDPHIARLHSNSLNRAIIALEKYTPI
ncbi:MAG: DUF4276 family protein [Methanomicrobiales archaeon]|jgi:hypothetical protein|nr:DUF4276 family protein [Methanomicrobiales archaeon]